jgi:hypothetical protein
MELLMVNILHVGISFMYFNPHLKITLIWCIYIMYIVLLLVCMRLVKLNFTAYFIFML